MRYLLRCFRCQREQTTEHDGRAETIAQHFEKCAARPEQGSGGLRTRQGAIRILDGHLRPWFELAPFAAEER